jgi:hypothetical protein
MIKKLLSIICILLLSSINAEVFDVFSDNVCGGGFGTFMSSWAIICYITILISLGILISIFLICRFLKIEKGELWAKLELVQIISTVLIIVLIVGFSEFILCTLTPKMLFGDMPGSGDQPMIIEAETYVTKLVHHNIRSFTSLAFIGTLREFFGNLQFGGDIINIEAKITPLKGLNSFDNSFEIIQMGLITVLITSMTQLMLFAYVTQGMFNVFLPVGILLRCFEPSRKFGGTLIGLTIALGIFWPLMLVVNNIALEGIGLFEIVDNLYMYVNNQLIDYPIISVAFNNPRDLLSVTNLISINVDLLSPLYTFYTALYTATWKILMINVLGSLFLPLLNFAIIAASMRELSRFFGEQIDLSNLTRMI